MAVVLHADETILGATPGSHFSGNFLGYQTPVSYFFMYEADSPVMAGVPWLYPDRPGISLILLRPTPKPMQVEKLTYTF